MVRADADVPLPRQVLDEKLAQSPSSLNLPVQASELWAEDRARQLRHAEIQPDERRLGFVAAIPADVAAEIVEHAGAGCRSCCPA